MLMPKAIKMRAFREKYLMESVIEFNGTGLNLQQGMDKFIYRKVDFF
jgi:hypothetical protein